MSATANHQTQAGSFATSRRGGLTVQEIREIEAHRTRDRPTPWHALAKRYGRCEADIRALFVSADTSVATTQAIAPLASTMIGDERRRIDRISARVSFWNDKRDRYLRMLFVDIHATAPDCANAIGTTVKSIEGRLRVLGIRASDRGQRRAA